jgi:hypothetical protein
MESTIPQAAENASRAKFLHPPVESALSRRSARHDPPVADSPDVIASTTDQDGLAVVLLSRIWNQKILRDHPEMHAHLDAVLVTVHEPEHVAADPRDSRLRYYRSHVGPSRWLLVVVSYEQEPARVITALATRKDPPSWSA